MMMMGSRPLEEGSSRVGSSFVMDSEEVDSSRVGLVVLRFRVFG